jgi:cytochrome c biogenesis protein CcdA
MLAYLKKTRRQMLLVGAGFMVGMFLAYFLLGLGLLGTVKTFSVSHGLSNGLACGVAILAFALAGWSLIDAVRYVRTGDTKQVTLGLPKRVKDRIHKVIRTGLTARGLVIGSLSVGFLVSILESLCTGQVYLPTIVFMTRAPGMRAAAIRYLLLYDVMFIVPLLAMLAMTYFGVRSETLGNMLRKRLALAKFGMAGMFMVLAIMLLITV